MRIVTATALTMLLAAVAARAEQVSVNGGPPRDVKSGDVIAGKHRPLTPDEREALRLLKLAVEAQCKAEPENCKPWVERPLPCAPMVVAFRGNEGGTATTDPETCDITITVGEPEPSSSAAGHSADDDD